MLVTELKMAAALYPCGMATSKSSKLYLLMLSLAQLLLFRVTIK